VETIYNLSDKIKNGGVIKRTVPFNVAVNFPLMTITSSEIQNSPGINTSNRNALKFDLRRAGQDYLKTIGNVLYGVKINKKMSAFIKKPPYTIMCLQNTHVMLS
jgi:hypothetical protein